MDKILQKCICLALLASSSYVYAAVPNGTGAATERVVAEWLDRWNEHDAQALGALLEPDVDFVLVNGVHLKGRQAFVETHAKQFAGRYDKSTFALTETPEVAFIGPGVAIVLWRWRITGVRDDGGAPAPAYSGIFTWTMINERGRWLVRAAQNTVDR